MQVIDYFDRGRTSHPRRTFLKDVDGGREVTYADAGRIVDRIAAALQREGVTVGVPVGVLSPNDVDAFLCVLGALRAGAAWVPLNARASAKELASLLRTTGCEVLLYHDALADVAAAVLDASPAVRTVVAIGGGGRPSDPVLETWMAPAGTVPNAIDPDPEREAFLSGTGGTTGKPKAVRMTNRMIETMTLAMLAHMPEPDPPVVAVAAPMTHAAGITCWFTIARGATLVIHPGFDADRLLRSIQQDRVTNLFLPPTAIYSLLAHPDVRDIDYSSLRYLVYAAAPMSVDKLREAIDVFGPVLCQTYGQAEAPMMLTCLEPADHEAARTDPSLEQRLASVGRPSYVAEIGIMDDDGQLLGPDEVGEIVTRGSLVMPGYLGDDAQTESTRRPGGWHGTSDVGYQDEDGFVYLVDRKRDMIITGGFNVWPSEIEQVIHGIAGVQDCAVIGVPDDRWGERVTAVVEPRGDAELDPEAIRNVCREELGPVKAPKEVIIRDLPRSPVGKILKRALREEYGS